MRKYELDVLAVTKGEQGASLYSARGECVTADGVATTVVDTVGAGDAFAAVLAAKVMLTSLSLSLCLTVAVSFCFCPAGHAELYFLPNSRHHFHTYSCLLITTVLLE